MPIPNALIKATFVWNKIKTHYRVKEIQVNSTKEQKKSSQYKSSQVKDMSSMHIQRPLIFLPIQKAIITATFFKTKIKTHYRYKEKQVKSRRE